MRLNTARGSGTGLVTVGPAKVKACRSILSIEVKINLSNSYDPKYVCMYRQGSVNKSIL